MENLIFAFASNDSNNINNKHFGESDFYELYNISEKSYSFIKQIKNNSSEEKFHSDPNKAKGVASILIPENVNVLVNKAFGGNIIKMKKKFVCIVSKYDRIETNIIEIQKVFNLILEQHKLGEDRDYIKL